MDEPTSPHKALTSPWAQGKLSFDLLPRSAVAGRGQAWLAVQVRDGSGWYRATISLPRLQGLFPCLPTAADDPPAAAALDSGRDRGNERAKISPELPLVSFELTFIKSPVTNLFMIGFQFSNTRPSTCAHCPPPMPPHCHLLSFKFPNLEPLKCHGAGRSSGKGDAPLCSMQPFVGIHQGLSTSLDQGAGGGPRLPLLATHPASCSHEIPASQQWPHGLQRGL